MSPARTHAGADEIGLDAAVARRTEERELREHVVVASTVSRVPPTCSVFFAQPGAESELGGGVPFAPKLPVLKTTSMSGCD